MKLEKESQEKLLDVATHLFADYGYDKVSIRQIANEAGVNSAMISYYFGGKKGLYCTILEKQMEPVQSFLQEDANLLSPKEMITRYAEVMEQVHEKSPTMLSFIYRELLAAKDEKGVLVERTMPRIYQKLSAAVEKGIQQHIFRADLDVFSAVIMLVGMLNFHFLSANMRNRMVAHKDSHIDVQIQDCGESRYVKEVLEIFFKGISAR